MRATFAIALAAILTPSLALAQVTPTEGDDTTQPAQPTQPTTAPPPVVVIEPTPAPPAPEPKEETTFVIPERESSYTTTSVNTPLILGGAIVFAGAYGGAAYVANNSDHPGADRLWVPVVGPWLALNDWGDCDIENPACDDTTTDKVLLIGDGVAQAVGLAAVVGGILTPREHVVSTSVAGVNLAPSRNGIVAFGKF